MFGERKGELAESDIQMELNWTNLIYRFDKSSKQFTNSSRYKPKMDFNVSKSKRKQGPNDLTKYLDSWWYDGGVVMPIGSIDENSLNQNWDDDHYRKLGMG